MKQIALAVAFLYSLTTWAQDNLVDKPLKYILIKATKEIPGEINQTAIDKLDEPLRAIAAYYSALGGSNCTQDTGYVETCDLTTALGLGTQGSEQHKALIKKWLADDKAAKQLLAQDCYQRPSGASSFSDYVYLTLVRQGNTVTINYNLMLYSQGSISYIKGPDKIIIQGNKLKVVRRSIWKHI
jgi:hypothetical protein